MEKFLNQKLNKDYFAQNGELLLKVIPDTLLKQRYSSQILRLDY